LRERLSDDAVEKVDAHLRTLEKDFGGETDIAIAKARYAFAADVVREAVHNTGDLSRTLTEKIDRVVLNRWLGLPIFLFIMYVMFLFTQNLGGAFIDFFDILFGGIFVDGLGKVLESVGCPDLLRVILADGMGGGVQTVATFVPPIFFLFLFLALLEDSGYMARAAFVMDRLMRAIGLPGRAFVPLIVGFGCNVPAIMATRTMDRANDRIITILMAPFMSCGARMPVYVLFATAFFPTNGQNLVFALYLIGIVVAIGTGFLMKRIVLPGAVGPFVMEIPAYHVPTLKGVMLRTWDRLKSFVERAGKTIVVVVAVLTFLNSWGTDGSFGNEDSDASVLSEIGRTVAPALAPMGVTADNWPAAVGVFTGVLAKEAVVGTMNALYDDMAKKNAASAEGKDAEQEEDWSLTAVLAQAGGSVLDNLADLGSALTDPLGLAVDDLSDTAAAAEAQEVTTDAVGVMQKLFGSRLAAFAYLMMVLLYMPCVAAVGAVYREAGLAWTLFLASWTTVLGYSAATIVYRLGNFATDPLYALCSVVACVTVIAGMLIFMRSYVQRNAGRRRVIAIRAA
ncbi:MAG: ferrous iron transport protein B, partial [Duodenibacillus sp.]